MHFDNPPRTLTEEQIESRVEKYIDHLDRVFMAGQMMQKGYDLAIRDVHAWAEYKYRELFATRPYHSR